MNARTVRLDILLSEEIAIYFVLLPTANPAKPTTNVSNAAMGWFQAVIVLLAYIATLLDAPFANNRTIALFAQLSLS